MQVARLHPTVNKRHQLPLCFGAETSFAGKEGENKFQPREDAGVLHLLESSLVSVSSFRTKSWFYVSVQGKTIHN